MSAYPEHERLRAVADQSQAAGEFIDWLAAKGIGLCYTANGDPCSVPLRGLLADWTDIDPDVIEAEKQAMLEALRTMNAGQA